MNWFSHIIHHGGNIEARNIGQIKKTFVSENNSGGGSAGLYI